MLSLGLTAAQYDEYLLRLATGYELKVTVQILTPEHAVVRTVSHILMDGQVNVTAPKLSKGDVEVSRTANLTFLDPGETLVLDSGSPADGAFYMDRMLRIIYSVRCSFGWVDVPVFTGPIIKVDRDGDMVDVECQGKERYALGAAWTAGTEDGRKGDVMTALMKRTGEITRYMDFPNPVARVAKPVAFGKEDTIWSNVWRVNSSMTRILYYDGRGVCQSRKRPTATALKLTYGTGGFLAALPQISYSIDELKNAIRVQGSRPSKHKPIPFYKAVPPASHPLSPQTLGRRGVGNYLADFIDNPDLKSIAACRSQALSELDDALMQQVVTTLQTLPIPHLEPWDVLQVTTPRFAVRIRANAFSLPLVQVAGAGKTMQIGSTRNLRRPHRRIGRP